MILNWYGNYSQGRGYSGSAEHMIIALDELGVDVRPIGISTEKSDHTLNYTEKGWKIKTKPFKLAEIGISYGFPNSFTSIFNKKKVGFTMFETSQFPKGISDWSGPTGNSYDQIKDMDLMLAPSKHSAQLIKDTGYKGRVEVVNLGFDPEIYPFMERPKNRKVFTFLIMGTLTIRKNPGVALMAFIDLFKGRKDVRLVIKSNSGTVAHMNMPWDNIEIIDEFSTNEQMKQYYYDADCFLFPSRGEGFGLPVIEAMGTGLPCIFSNHSGLAEFANPKYNYPINKYSMEKAQRYPKKWGDVGDWYNPDYDEFKSLMKYVEQNKDKAYNKGVESAKWVRKNFTYKQTAKRLKSILETL